MTDPDMNYEVDDPEMKATLRSIGDKIGGALKAGWGFMLMLFEFGPPGSALFYISSADRKDVVRLMAEWMAKQLEAQCAAPMIELNPNHPTTRAAHENWHKVLALVLYKFRDVLGDEVTITGADIEALAAGFDGMPSVVIDDDASGLHLRLVDEAEGTRLARAAGGLAS